MSNPDRNNASTNNATTPVHFQCYPELGGKLNALMLSPDGERTVSVLHGFDSQEEIISDTTFCNVLLFPFVNRLKDGSYSHHGQSYQFPVNDTENGNALHGFLFARELDVNTATEVPNQQNCYTDLTLSYSYRSEFEFYPFDIDFQVRYAILKPDTFRIEISITNAGDTTAPVATGWHPYFDLGHRINELKCSLPPAHKIEVDERLIPTGRKEYFDYFHQPNNEPAISLDELEFDNCFLLDSNHDFVTRLYSPRENITVELSQAANLPYLQFFTPPDRRSVAAEPMSANINAFQNEEGLMELGPGDTFDTHIQVCLKATR